MNNFHSKKRKRHGFTFVELLVAILLVGVTLALVAQMMSISLQQNLTGQRRLANVEIANSVFEIISALPYDDLDDSVLNRPEFSQIRNFIVTSFRLKFSLCSLKFLILCLVSYFRNQLEIHIKVFVYKKF